MDSIDESLPKKWILGTNFVKRFYFDLSERAIVGTSDSCRANRIINKSDLAKVSILLQSPYMVILKLLIFMALDPFEDGDIA